MSHSVAGTHKRHLSWGLEPCLLGLVGVAAIWQQGLAHHFSVVEETIVLVIFLGGLMGITRIPFPKKLPLWAYPLAAAGMSVVMDSFLVLLMLMGATLTGSKKGKATFRALCVNGALIGGLGSYFGEVYELPLALQYGMREWYSMLPIIPPILVYVGLLCVYLGRQDVQVTGMKSLGHGGGGEAQKSTADRGDYIEFAVAIAVLLIWHNPLLCLGVLFVYSFVTGQGKDLIDVMKTETEVGVMLLLVFAAFVADPVRPYMAEWAGWWIMIPATINGVLTGAIFPASGDVWIDTIQLSTCVQLTPISSLVGIMVYKTWKDWKEYMKISIPCAVLWFVIASAWFFGPWQMIKPHYEAQFGAPTLQTSTQEDVTH